MSLTRKHFERIADIIRYDLDCLGDWDTKHAQENLAASFAYWFEQENDRFDSAKFYTRCGLNEDGSIQWGDNRQHPMMAAIPIPAGTDPSQVTKFSDVFKSSVAEYFPAPKGGGK